MGRQQSVLVLIRQLEAFLDSTDRSGWSPESASKIEGFLCELFEEDDEMMELADDLAQYRPEGGDHLFSYTDIKPKVAQALKQLKKSGAT